MLPLKTDGKFQQATVGAFAAMFDHFHPYWLHRKFIFVSNRTFFGHVTACVYFSNANAHKLEECGYRQHDMDLMISQLLISMLNVHRNQYQKLLQRVEALENQKEWQVRLPLVSNHAAERLYNFHFAHFTAMDYAIDKYWLQTFYEGNKAQCRGCS